METAWRSTSPTSLPLLEQRTQSISGLSTVHILASYPNTPTESYSYDAVGNRTSSHLSAAYTHQSFNRLTSTASAIYTYGNNGNRVTKVDAGGTTQYAWDFENGLKQVTLPSGDIVTYKYDAPGRRIERSTLTPSINHGHDSTYL
jgi:YD repeat-containing protein